MMNSTVEQGTANFKFTEEHDALLVREVLLFEPWNHPSGSRERGKCWEHIAESLNSLESPKFSVTKRATRERCDRLIEKVKKKQNDEAKASGIAPPELTEAEEGIADIIERFKEAESDYAVESLKKKQQKEAESAKAEDMRRKSLETFSETQKRKGDDDEKSCSSKKRSRRSGSEAINFLREKTEEDRSRKDQEMQLQREELVLRRQELEAREKSNQQYMWLQHQQFQQNQQATSQLLQQQQQMLAAMIGLLKNNERQ